MRRDPLDVPAIQFAIIAAGCAALVAVYAWRTGGL